MTPRSARLLLGSAYSTVRGRIDPLGGWAPARRSGWTLAAALLLSLCPLLLGWLALGVMVMAEPDVLTGQSWPLAEALGLGLTFGVLKAAVAAPFFVGVCAAAWRMLEGETKAAAPSLLLTVYPSSTDSMLLGRSAIGAEPSATDVLDQELQTQGNEFKQDDAELTKDVRPLTHEAADRGIFKLKPELADMAKNHAHSTPEDARATNDERTHQPGALLTEKHAMGRSPEDDVGPKAEPGLSRSLSRWPHSPLPPWPAGLKAEPLASEDEPAHPSTTVSERD